MEKGEHCMPIMTLHCRRLIWLTGHGDTFFRNQGVSQDELLEAANHPFIGCAPAQPNPDVPTAVVQGDIEEGGVAATEPMPWEERYDERDLADGADPRRVT